MVNCHIFTKPDIRGGFWNADHDTDKGECV